MFAQAHENAADAYTPSPDADQMWMSYLALDVIRGGISKERFLVLLSATEPEERCIGDVSQP